MSKQECATCVFERATGITVDTSKSKAAWAKQVGVSEASIRRHIKHGPEKPQAAAERFETSSTGEQSWDFLRERPVTREDAEKWLRSSGEDPDDYIITVSAGAYGHDMWTNKMRAVPKIKKGELFEPKWPVVQPANPRTVERFLTPKHEAREDGWNVAVLMSDTQFGYRNVNGELDPFHDDEAIRTAMEIVAAVNPDRVVVMGDIVDLPSQSKYAQEASFAQTTQAALDRTYQFSYGLRQLARRFDGG